ncbi:MAG: S1 RNA-binding domain-containing protein [Planctomycetes bacterium]|nr:S1 RNA-binding domain-containing protein [Planctomycetota bacterium]
MTDSLILDSLARETKTSVDSIRAAFEMLDAGLSAPFVGRFRRDRTGGLTEGQIRRLEHRRAELEELDRRRATVLRALERDGAPEAALSGVRGMMDRFELEDQYLPFRRPEPEVQLALDRGLGALADELTRPVPRSERPQESRGEEAEDSPSGAEGDAAEAPAETPAESAPEPTPEAGEPAAPDATEGASDEAAGDAPQGDEGAEGAEGPAGAEAAPAEEPTPAADSEGSAAPEGADTAEDTAADTVADTAADPAEGDGSSSADGAGSSSERGEEPAAAEPVRVQPSEMLTPELARVCAQFVDPDKGVHSEAEALAGAMRILADRLGRNPALRAHVRRMMRKHGDLRVRPLVDDKRAGRHKPLLKLKSPLRQLQGPKLVALRQAQKERVLATAITMAPERALARVRTVLGKHTRPEFGPLLDAVALSALEQRLLPMVEADVRLELKERGDQEALRYLAQHLRAQLLAPAHGPLPMVGIDVSAKGDWTVAVVGRGGDDQAVARIELGEKDDAALGAELAAVVGDSDPRALLIAGGKSSHGRLKRLRSAARAGGIVAPVLVASDAGLSTYASSERARKELPERSVPERAAISLARRGQDPMAELLKVQPWQLSLGSEQSLVSKANLRRALLEMVESCAALVGCRVNTAPDTVLRALPGLDDEAVERILARRAERPFTSREDLRADGTLTEAQWMSVAAFLKIPDSEEPLDRTALHPEQYPLAHKVLESVGTTVAEGLGRPGVTKGLKRAAAEIDEHTWRDLMRELSFPGRDPRPRNRMPELLDPDTDPVRLQPGRVVEGVVTSVAGFGAFVDIGLGREAMLHVSELGRRYLRDAREEIATGQVVRATLKECSEKRLVISMRDVPPPTRGDRGERGERRGGRRGEREERKPRVQLRPGDARGMPLGDPSGKRRRPGGPGGPGGRRDRPERGERVDLRQINAQAAGAGSSNPFAKFFGKESEAPAAPEGAKPPKAKKPKAPKPAAEEPRVDAPAPDAVTPELGTDTPPTSAQGAESSPAPEGGEA